MASKDRKVDIVFGAGGIGNSDNSFTYTWTSPESVNSLLSMLKSNHIRILDSAAAYPPGGYGDANRLLGLSNASQSTDFDIDTKIGFASPTAGFAGSLGRENIDHSVKNDLALLKVKKVRCLYAHAPDDQTPDSETAAAFDEQVRKGHCEFIGICNYTTARLREYIKVCEEHGYVLPKLYQGFYSALHRFPEQGLLDLCREHDIKFYAYSPLSGGFLTGKVTAARTAAAQPADGPENPSSVLYRTRFDKTSILQQYNNLYDLPEVHAAMLRFKAACDAQNPPLSTAEASLRWLVYHSALGAGDGIILGAKRTDQLQDNLDQIAKGPLSDEAKAIVEKLWADCEGLIDPKQGFES